MKRNKRREGIFDVRVKYTETGLDFPNPDRRRKFFIPRQAFKPAYVLDSTLGGNQGYSGPAKVWIGVINKQVRRDPHLVTQCLGNNTASQNKFYENENGIFTIPFLLIKIRKASDEEVNACLAKKGKLPKLIFGHQSFLTNTSPLRGISEEEKKNYSCLVLLEAGSAARPGLKKGYILTDEEISFKFVVHADRMGSIDVANNNGDIIETHRGPDI